jgi:steroid 5-alpha reductase family enzyme
MAPRLRRWLGRVGWLAALWAGGVAALAVVALLLRVLMQAAGMREH